ncbi:hypothetical protein JHK86_004513 [Glycine max]|nr:hypothetical protein JHK86_004513 [Glycine max]
MLVWVRFLSLNMVYYDESFLMGLALVFGKPIKVDLNTLNAEYRRFARVYVEVNLNKSVVGRINIRRGTSTMLSTRVCTSYGHYGHRSRECTHKPQVETMAANSNARLAVAEAKNNHFCISYGFCEIKSYQCRYAWAKMLKFPKVGSTSSATKENDMAIDQVALVPNRDHPSEMIDASEVDPRPRQ